MSIGSRARSASATSFTPKRWTPQRNVLRADGGHLSASAQRPASSCRRGRRGRAFLVFRNFDAIYSYNQAESYGLAISHLADRLAGHPPLRTPWHRKPVQTSQRL
jgi:membrane-bound lytic murein transglycosylase B